MMRLQKPCFYLFVLEQEFADYREYVYECGALEKNKGAVIDEKILKTERQRKFALSKKDRFLYRTRYFSEGIFLGSKEFVRKNFERFKKILKVEKDRRPISIQGLTQVCQNFATFAQKT